MQKVSLKSDILARAWIFFFNFILLF